MRWIQSILCCFLILGCSSKVPQFNSQFNQLQPGMTTEQVRHLLGDPNLRELPHPALEWWHYAQEEGRIVVFEEGKVTRFGREGVVNAPPPGPESPNTANPPLPPPPKAIGESCKVDSECQDHNCHFHTCSGKNNCQVPLGKICAQNGDCCSGRCDFGFCKKP